MSLIVAVHNGEDIAIAWDRQSRYSQDGRAFMPTVEVQKVSKVGDHLALMVTGSYNSDKLPLFANFEQRHAHDSLEEAFKALYELGNKLVLRSSERGLMVGLAGYISGQPTFRFVQRTYGDPDLGYVLDHPINYYLSGASGPVDAAQARVQADGLTVPRPIAEITAKLESIVTDCIAQYPGVLVGPTEILTLFKP